MLYVDVVAAVVVAVVGVVVAAGVVIIWDFPTHAFMYLFRLCGVGLMCPAPCQPAQQNKKRKKKPENLASINGGKERDFLNKFKKCFSVYNEDNKIHSPPKKTKKKKKNSQSNVNKQTNLNKQETNMQKILREREERETMKRYD